MARQAASLVRIADVAFEMGVAPKSVFLVLDVSPVRKFIASWAVWAGENDLPGPQFNWTAVYNFNSGADAVMYSLGDKHESEAIMLARIGHVARCDGAHRGPLVYVHFLEVAPWNKPTASGRRFKGLGPIMLRIACELSDQAGYGGRVGLHSLAAAENFYCRIGFRGLDCPNEYNELYFELDEFGAGALLSE